MTKVAIKNENITSFGGIYHIMDVFSKLGLGELLESVLGKRGSSDKAFCYGDVISTLFFSYLCGGECLEDINALVRHFNQRPDTRLPGADTVGRGLKELAEKDTVYKCKASGMSYRFNTADNLNVLLLRMIRRPLYGCNVFPICLGGGFCIRTTSIRCAGSFLRHFEQETPSSHAKSSHKKNYCGIKGH